MSVRVQREDFDVGAELAALAAGNKRVGAITSFVGLVLLWAAAGLTLITGYDYLRSALAHMTETEPPPPREAKPKVAGKPADSAA